MGRRARGLMFPQVKLMAVLPLAVSAHLTAA